MNTRDRYIGALRFERPDPIPFLPGGPRESTLNAWRAQGLPEGADWLEMLCKEVGVPHAEACTPFRGAGFDHRLIPQFEEKVIERRAHSLVVQDWKGNVCEIEDRFDVSYLRHARDFVTRRWIRCPVENRDDWERLKERYDPDAPGRFRGVDAETLNATGRDYITRLGVTGPFWQMREWLGFEGLCERFLTDPDMIADMARFWTDFVASLFERLVRDYGVPDEVIVNEDMAYKEKVMVSLDLTREYLMPAWRRWGEILNGAGCPLYTVDSDGFIEPLVPLWIESGFVCQWPIEAAAGNDLPAMRQRHGERMAYRGGVDKRAMAKGGEAIRAELDRLEPAVRAGGFIPSCDHGIPSDVSWPAMIEYGRALGRLTGWI